MKFNRTPSSRRVRPHLSEPEISFQGFKRLVEKDANDFIGLFNYLIVREKSENVGEKIYSIRVFLTELKRGCK